MSLLLDKIVPYLGIIKIIGGLVLIGSLIGGVVSVKHKYDNKIRAAEASVWIAKEAKEAKIAADDLAKDNEQLRKAQAELAVAIADQNKLQEELQNEKVNSAGLQADLASGAKRMRILIAANSKSGASRPAEGSSSGQMDNGAETTADIAPSAASAIERLRENENEAIKRLDGCVAQYGAVKNAADAVQK